MIILDTVGDSIQAISDIASAITLTLYGIETTTADAYKKLGQAQIGTSATTLYTVPSSASTIADMIIICNTSSSNATITIYHVPNGGTAGDGNALLKDISVPANKTFVWNKGTLQSAPPSSSSGDMLKSVYDTDNDGIVDKAESVDDGTYATTAEHVKDSYTHATGDGSDHADVATNTANIATLDTNKADKSNVLERDNTDSYTPTANYHPATKKYVDDNAGGGGGMSANKLTARDLYGGI